MKTNLQDIYVDHLFKASSNRQDLILIFIKVVNFLKFSLAKTKQKLKILSPISSTCTLKKTHYPTAKIVLIYLS